MKRDLAMAGLGVAAPVAYLLIARLMGAVGFPLDDAWIHQTYARNLGWDGQWAFILGQPSAGSTSPLWTLLLAVGYTLRIDYLVWTTALNALLLGGLAWLAYRLSNQWWVGVLVALEWHLVWAAASGMETILFSVLVLGAWLLASSRERRTSQKSIGGAAEPPRLSIFGSPLWRSFWGGVLIGLALWARPDGLTLLPFCGVLVWQGEGAGRQPGPVKRLGAWLGGAVLILLPYFLFNLALSGQLWPNTFFAKPAEYASLLALPLWQRLAQIFSAPFIGGLAVLLPGIVLGARRRWAQLAWVGAFLLAYTLRLPVAYQHGRYLIPVIPLLLVIGAEGLAGWVRADAPQLWRRVASRAWAAAVGAVVVAFWLLGARALAADVNFIESEMVTTAKWAAVNIPSQTAVAAHDIGALGYFTDLQLIDLAGLASPEVIPVLGDEARLWAFIRQSQAAYLITYPGWCPSFGADPALTPVFRTGTGCDNMTVYRLRQ